MLDIITLPDWGIEMTLDAGLRKQLVAARANITTQLIQLEGAALDPFSFGGSPDCRDVYAELQQELREIDDLLGTHRRGRAAKALGESVYEPMATFATPQGQWMWRFRGVAVGQIALVVISWLAFFALRNGRTGLLATAAWLGIFSIASAWMAMSNRERELRLFLFTLAIGTGMVTLAVLGAALIA